MIDKTSIQDFPPMTASLLADNSGVFRVGTAERYLSATDAGTARRQLVELMQAEARTSGRPIRVTVTDPTSVTVLLVGVDGELQEEPQSVAPARGGTPAAPAPPMASRRVTLIQAPPGVPPQAGPATTTPPAQPTPPQRPAVQQQRLDAPPFQPMPSQPSASQPSASQPSAPQPSPPQPMSAQRSVPTQQAAPTTPTQRQPAPAPQAPQHQPPVAPQQPTGVQAPAPAARRDLRDAPSFLAPPTIGPAQHGLAGLLNKLGFSMPPSANERAERDDVNAVSRHFPRRRTISVANQKGGANKTPTVVNLSSVFARYGGGGVAAWDNNETMGTLGWRTEHGGHDSTVLDLLAAAGDLLSPGAERADLSRFVHHQPGDKYEVLRSAADGEHVVTADEVDLVHRVLAKYYRLIVMDSGNSAGAPNWRRMVELTDQLVIPTTTVEDKKEGARLTLTAVSRVSERGAELARNAVVIVSEAEAKDTSIANAYAEDFRPYVRDVVVVPFDPALKNGVIRHDALRSNTQRAWLAAAAAVSRGL
ncbi:chromosome partitioning protein ParA [Plantibacter sp. VKM Ac-2880]|uniref:MinD/ParA family ATP-binding protein n=1 Tax=Plantibacter sp. VKM Ac-2880 TaxID=2783827 RepID=UPI00188EE856|nr:chromosome partitioning protein ParA [Plantibacter sp. VKM Ac-2880]MBF4567156.1 chromosome partitioning protein ParA [Plantibacter sp. VKM Ac-2880]